MVKQPIGTELQSQTLASLRTQISQALESLIDERHSSTEAMALRVAFKSSTSKRKPASQDTGLKLPMCPLCTEARRKYQHFLSKCRYLPECDILYLNTVRQTIENHDDQHYDDDQYDSIYIQYEASDNNIINLCTKTAVSPSS